MITRTVSLARTSLMLAAMALATEPLTAAVVSGAGAAPSNTGGTTKIFSGRFRNFIETGDFEFLVGPNVGVAGQQQGTQVNYGSDPYTFSLSYTPGPNSTTMAVSPSSSGSPFTATYGSFGAFNAIYVEVKSRSRLSGGNVNTPTISATDLDLTAGAFNFALPDVAAAGNGVNTNAVYNYVGFEGLSALAGGFTLTGSFDLTNILTSPAGLRTAPEDVVLEVYLSNNPTFQDPSAIPEPSTYALLGGGLTLMAVLSRKRK